MLPAILFASLLGTYLDLYFVGIGMYAFPLRLLPDIFSINILFTLIGLPLLILFFLFVAKRLSIVKKAGFILCISLLMASVEKWSEEKGLFVHDESWRHYYSFIGYFFYLVTIYLFYRMSALRNQKK
ncbi:hypothetical protein F7731_20470 [Cytobacillus depressus]|uniref:Group-specific protein n=1 Tax=Cytobacillus depressus TaxID=1602942 RepID=A0A6L3V1U8_9BACI|nr:CBO0543 family protein [Cytobacillus depressus]KAB2330163.1 hypothetical protein F7731_20470 [Cytobacillus depressus]